jgi:hypothetical protein
MRDQVARLREIIEADRARVKLADKVIAAARNVDDEELRRALKEFDEALALQSATP